jgi:hypothetical protein
MEPMTSGRHSTKVQRLLSRFNETGRQFHVNGITMNGQARTAVGALVGASFVIAPTRSPAGGCVVGTAMCQNSKRRYSRA